MWPIFAAILPFLGKAAAGLLAGGKMLGGAALTAGKTMLPQILSAAASNLLGGGGQQQTGQAGQPSDIIGGQQMPIQAPQNLFEYQPRNISQALMKLLQSSRGF